METTAVTTAFKLIPLKRHLHLTTPHLQWSCPLHTTLTVAQLQALCETVHFTGERVALDSLTYNERARIEVEDGSDQVIGQCLFDATPEKYLTMVVTEYETINGNSPPNAIGSIIRKQEGPDEPV